MIMSLKAVLYYVDGIGAGAVKLNTKLNMLKCIARRF